MQTGSSETLIGWKFGKTKYVPQWDLLDGAWLWLAMAMDSGWYKIVIRLVVEKPVIESKHQLRPGLADLHY
jgi:hypothetical protein